MDTVTKHTEESSLRFDVSWDSVALMILFFLMNLLSEHKLLNMQIHILITEYANGLHITVLAWGQAKPNCHSSTPNNNN